MTQLFIRKQPSMSAGLNIECAYKSLTRYNVHVYCSTEHASKSLIVIILVFLCFQFSTNSTLILSGARESGAWESRARKRETENTRALGLRTVGLQGSEHGVSKQRGCKQRGLEQPSKEQWGSKQPSSDQQGSEQQDSEQRPNSRALNIGFEWKILT